MSTNFVTGNKLSDTDIQTLLNAKEATSPPIVGEDELAFYRADAMLWATPAGELSSTLKSELEFLASLGVAVAPAKEGEPWHIDRLTVGDLYNSGGATTAGILLQDSPDNAKRFLQFLRRTTLPAYVGQAQAISNRLPPTIHAGIAARQQAIAAEGAIRKIESLFVSQP